jgi:hypothetical protein
MLLASLAAPACGSGGGASAPATTPAGAAATAPATTNPFVAVDAATSTAVEAPGLQYAVFDGSPVEVDAEDLTVRKLYDSAPSGLLFAPTGLNPNIVFAGVVGGDPRVQMLDLAPGATDAALCRDAVISAETIDVVAHDLTSGTVRWRTPQGAPVTGVVCGGGDTVVVATNAGFTGVASSDGSVKWSVDGVPSAPPLAAGDRVTLSMSTGVVVAEQDTGDSIWRVDAPGATALQMTSSGILLRREAGVALYSADGEELAVLGTLETDFRGAFGTELNFNEITIAGPADDPVLVLVRRSTLVGRDGSFPALPSPIAAAFGASADALVWASSAGGRGVQIVRMTGDAVVRDSIAVDLEFTALAATERVVFGGVEGVPAMVVLTDP